MTVPSILPVNKAIKRHSIPQKTDIIRERLISQYIIDKIINKIFHSI